jgi:hypothetical protein
MERKCGFDGEKCIKRSGRKLYGKLLLTRRRITRKDKDPGKNRRRGKTIDGPSSRSKEGLRKINFIFLHKRKRGSHIGLNFQLW